MSARFKMGDLLIDSKVRFVVADKGSTWVTDRFVMVRGDLFKQVPKERRYKDGKPLPVSVVRTILAKSRGNGKRLESLSLRYVGQGARAWRAGAAVLFLNERVTRTYFLAGLRPRYIASGEIVAWYGKKRGRDVLMVVQKPAIPWSLDYSDLEECAA